MSTQPPVRTAMIGCGRMAQGHIRAMLAQQETTQIVAVCEPSEAAYAQTRALFTERGLTPPPNEPGHPAAQKSRKNHHLPAWPVRTWLQYPISGNVGSLTATY